jgi:POT family proton-dependent oligopeptide transporter
VRIAKQAGEMDRDADWEVTAQVPPEAGEVEFIAGLPIKRDGDKAKQLAYWEPGTRTLRVTENPRPMDEAQLRAAGADPQFRQAVTQIYRESSVLKVSIFWLLAFYLVITIGELCLSPVGLSLVTKAAHPKYVGLFMGFWFLTTGAVSNFLAHFVGGYWGTMTPGEYFIIFGVVGLIATVIMLLMLRVLKPMLHGIH